MIPDALAKPDELDRHLAGIQEPAAAAQLARDFAALARAKGRNANLEVVAYAKAARRCGELLLPENLPREPRAGPGRGNRQKTSSDSRTRFSETLAACQIAGDTANRWQQLAKIEQLEFAEWCAAVEADERDAALRDLLKATKDMDVHYSSETPEWYTPPEIIERTVTVLGHIDLDPCSNEGNPNVPARRHFTAADDGLNQVWAGRVYMNPPYGDVIADWVEKLRDEHVTGNVPEAIALVPARTDTAWWQETFNESAVCYVRGRLRFSGAENSAPFPSAVAYFGDRLDAFVGAFADMGEVRTCV